MGEVKCDSVKRKPLSAGVVLVRRSGEACNYLLLRAYNYWDFPKGLVASHEEPLQAACREVAEETGITEPDFGWGDEFRETSPYGRGKIARYYVASTAQEHVCLPISPELGRPEHHEYRWVSAEEAWSLLVPRVQAVLGWAARVTGCGAPAE